MFNKSLVLCSLLISSMYSQNIDDIVRNTISQNYNIKSLESSIEISKEQISLASKWKNPIISIGATDIQLKNISKRDLEPMQAQFIGYSQVIPVGDKLKIEKTIAKNDYEISQLKLEDRKLQLKSKIYEYIYTIKLLEERLSLFEEFKSNTLTLEKLLTQLYKYNKANQVQILNSKIMYQELNLKSQNLKTMINTLNLNLEQITYEKIIDVDFDNRIKDIKLYTNIDTHPKILSLIQNSKKFNNISNLELEKKNSDVKMNIAYFKRDSKFEDYINLSFAIPLSVNGSEEIKSRKAKFKAIEINHKLKDLKLTFKNQIHTFQQNMDDAQISFNLIDKNILPRYKQLQKILENYNSLKSFKNINTKSIINNLNETIKYKLKAVDEKQKYFTALAKSTYFIKEI